MALVLGRFNDGRTAASRAVEVAVTPAGLEIRDGADGLLVAFWQRDDLTDDGPLPNGKGRRLRCAQDAAARLSLDDAALLMPLLPQRRRRAMPWRTIAISTVCIILLVLGIWQGIPAGSRLLTAMMPLSLEQRWGDRLAQGLEKQWGRCEAPAGEAALALLSDRIAAGLPQRLRPRRVMVVRTSVENAIALPGGTVMIFDGLLDNATSSDELAGVLAHEFTHLRYRHSTASMIRAMGVGVVVVMLTGDASGILATGAAMALMGSYSRDDETAADRGAVELLNQAGMNPRGLISFFRRLEGNTGPIPAWLSTHPDSADRAAMIEALTAHSDQSLPPALTPEQWTALKGICN